MSSKAGSSLCGYQGWSAAAAGEVVGVVAVQRVPDDDEAVDAEAQWHGAFHRALQPVAGLADAEQLFAAGDGDRRADLARVGAHRLRHSLATEMLRAGASLPEVAQVLRHRSLLSTSIYAKVDDNALRGTGASVAGR